MNPNLTGFALDPHGVPPTVAPDDVADLLIRARSQFPMSGMSHLSAEQLREVVNVAFYGSLFPDEGRFPRFRLFSFALPVYEFKSSIILNFSSGLEYNLENLRRLAPAFPSYAVALGVSDRHGKLEFTEVVNIEPSLVGTDLDRPEYWLGSAPVGLMVIADGPGNLRISESVCTLRLRAGQLVQLRPYWRSQRIIEWADSVGQAMLAELKAAGYPEAVDAFGGLPTVVSLILNNWAQILMPVVGKRHGGAFLILDDLKCGEDLHVRFHADDLSLGRAQFAYWKACLDAKRETTPWATGTVLIARESLFSRVRAIAALAQVDGCVVLDRQQSVLGFGAEIRTSHEDALASPLAFVDGTSGQSTDDQAGVRLGSMRHRSLFRYCKAHAGTLGFVVSQDGDLTACISDPQSVIWVKDLAARLHDAFRHEPAGSDFTVNVRTGRVNARTGQIRAG